LDNPGSIPQEQESDLAARAFVVEPTLKLNFLADVFRKIFYIDAGHEGLKKAEKYSKVILLLQSKWRKCAAVGRILELAEGQ
jgi:hypothetical protein